ncbi:MAG: hypothetical protein SCARUB_00840 [Candidatus Scalindua rubra]|uniref:Ancillary SecYEG translocon subunit/Cell division coordinator CpoB TPR domain-containing protein n=1 Tax=Candidatus Scalindua rubra TaxID=1872076 RepID=A0A1E3XEG2_9BACT|nr:MAG: hypothetical protein SCARUB_00840 [Candidatus Scalindua rubra]
MENVKERIRKYLKILDENKWFIIIGFIILIAAGIPTYLYKQKKNNDFNKVWSRVFQLNYEVAVAQQEGPEKKTEALKGAINEYTFLKNNLSTTSATPWLLLELGNAQYKVKKYDEAISTYKEFINRFYKHHLTPVVRQSLGYVFEEKEQLKDAIEQFEIIAKDPESTYIKAQAKLDTGRCYEKLGQLNSAVAVYKDVIDFLPESSWAKMAKYRLEDID